MDTKLNELNKLYIKVYNITDFFARDLTAERLHDLGLDKELTEEIKDLFKIAITTGDTLLDVLGELIAEERDHVISEKNSRPKKLTTVYKPRATE